MLKPTSITSRKARTWGQGELAIVQRQQQLQLKEQRGEPQ